MSESFRTRLMRFTMNHWPAIRGTGSRVQYIAGDWSEIRVEVPMNWRTYNAVGTIFGGSMYAATDPYYMLMLMARLGPDYIVWDRAASIRFRRPGTSTLQARFHLDDEEIDTIRQALVAQDSIRRMYHVELVDEGGQVCATVEKELHIQRGDRRQQGSGGPGANFISWMLSGSKHSS